MQYLQNTFVFFLFLFFGFLNIRPMRFHTPWSKANALTFPGQEQTLPGI